MSVAAAAVIIVLCVLNPRQALGLYLRLMTMNLTTGSFSANPSCVPEDSNGECNSSSRSAALEGQLLMTVVVEVVAKVQRRVINHTHAV